MSKLEELRARSRPFRDFEMGRTAEPGPEEHFELRAPEPPPGPRGMWIGPLVLMLVLGASLLVFSWSLTSLLRGFGD